MKEQIMKPIITKFNSEKAGTHQNGNLQAFDLVPDTIDSKLVFHWVKVKANAVTDPEANNVSKTFLFYEGQCVIEMDGNEVLVEKGDALWLPINSVHTIKNSNSDLQFIVVKEKS